MDYEQRLKKVLREIAEQVNPSEGGLMSISEKISEMTFEEKVKALIKEGGYSRKEAIELLHEMGE